MNATIQNITAAEASIVSAIDSAARQLDAVGVDSVASALDRLHQSAESAKERLSAAVAELSATLAGVLQHVQELVGTLQAPAPAPEQHPASTHRIASPASGPVLAPETRPEPQDAADAKSGGFPSSVEPAMDPATLETGRAMIRGMVDWASDPAGYCDLGVDPEDLTPQPVPEVPATSTIARNGRRRK